MQHLDEGTIHAWLDGQLPPGEAESVEAHVAECRPCADAVAEARGLIAASSRILMSLDGVPRDVAPKQAVPNAGSGVASGSQAPLPPSIVPEVGSDVRPIGPTVVAGSASTASTPAARRARRRWMNGPSLAAAATILVAVGTFAVVRGGGGRGPEPAAFDAVASSTGPFADSATPALERAAPQAAASVQEPAPALGRGAAPANRAQSEAAAPPARALTLGARSERDQASLQDRADGRADAVSAKTGSATASARNERASVIRPAAPSPAPQRATDEIRLAKERVASSADSTLTRQQFAATRTATAPAEAREAKKADTNTVTVIRGSSIAPQVAKATPQSGASQGLPRAVPPAAPVQAPADQRDATGASNARAEVSRAARVAATGSVRGRVTDANSTGIAGAQVVIAGTNTGTTTNDRGEFTLGGVEVGERQLSVRRIGYSPENQSVAVTAGQTITSDVVLRPSTASLTEVVVTGTATTAQRRAAGSAVAGSAPVAAGSPSGSVVPASASAAVGCYELGITSATGPARGGFRQVPRRIALDSEIVPATTDGIWYRARDLSRTGAFPNGLWRPLGTDGVELEWNYGTRFARIRLTGAPRTMMRGTIDETDRSAGTNESGTVVSSRLSCER